MVLNSLTSFFNYGVKKDAMIEPDKVIKKPVLHPGKMDVNWDDITCTCAVGDSLIMGFGNGALVCLDTRSNIQLSDSIQFIDLGFTDSNEKSEDIQEQPIEKLKMLYMDPMQQLNNGVSKIIAQGESLLLSLSGGTISCNSFPEFEKLDVLDVDQILDFEIYKNRSQKYI